LVSLEVHGSKISFYRNIFLSQYRNIVRQNVSCELGLTSHSEGGGGSLGADKYQKSITYYLNGS